MNLSLLYYVAWWLSFAYAKDCTLVGGGEAKQAKLLKKIDAIKGKNFTATDEKNTFKYTVGICTGVMAGDDNVGVAAIQEEPKSPGPGSKVHILGLYNQTQVMGGNNWLYLKYKDGENYTSHCDKVKRQAHLMIVCDPEGGETHLRIIEEHNNISHSDTCYYLFELSTPIVCVVPPVPQEALSGGSIFCIIFFTILGIYLIIGFLYQRIVVGAKGLEQIPNYNFWKDFGQLQADGCDFVCRCGERQDAKMYRGIDDQLLNPEPRDDRDDRLLPM